MRETGKTALRRLRSDFISFFCHTIFLSAPPPAVSCRESLTFPGWAPNGCSTGGAWRVVRQLAPDRFVAQGNNQSVSDKPGIREKSRVL